MGLLVHAASTGRWSICRRLGKGSRKSACLQKSRSCRNIGEHIHLTNEASKGKSGRIIALNKELRKQLIKAKEIDGINIADARRSVIKTQRGQGTTAQVIVNSFAEWYRKLGFVGCSSHRGRRSFITQAARKASLVGGSLRDVQALAGHASLTTTSRYIEADGEAQARLVNIV